MVDTDASNGAIIHGGIPVITMLLAARLRRESVGMSMLGDGLVLLSAVGLGAYLVLGRRAFPEGANLELVGGVAVFGLLLMIPASAVEIATVGIDRPTSGDVLNLLYLGVGASALAFVLWGYGLRHLEAGQAAAFANLNPLVGVIVAATLLGETISPLQLAGGTMIISGVWLTSTRPAARRIGVRHVFRSPAKSPA